MDNWTEFCKKGAVGTMERFLRVLALIPEDKLTWSPSPTAKSALQIAAHTAVATGNFVQMIRDRKLPMGDEIPELVARTKLMEESLTSLSAIERALRQNTADVLAAIDGLSPEEMEIVLDSSMGWTMPMTALMNLPATHVNGHIYQLDYLQTCWGDMEVHF